MKEIIPCWFSIDFLYLLDHTQNELILEELKIQFSNLYKITELETTYKKNGKQQNTKTDYST
jgi:hypothetical protein